MDRVEAALKRITANVASLADGTIPYEHFDAVNREIWDSLSLAESRRLAAAIREGK